MARLGVEFTVESPDVDETPRPPESPVELALRLSNDKAAAVFARNSGATVIGSDQVCHCGKRLFGKPMSVEAAKKQLIELSGQRVEFVTALSVHWPGNSANDHSVTRVRYRQLDEGAIDQYLQRDSEAIHCAGACRAEGPGIALCEEILSDDPTSLIGLPLIRLVRLLETAGIRVVQGWR